MNIYHKSLTVIQSCTTFRQGYISLRYVHLAKRYLSKPEYSIIKELWLRKMEEMTYQ